MQRAEIETVDDVAGYGAEVRDVSAQADAFVEEADDAAAQVVPEVIVR